MPARAGESRRDARLELQRRLEEEALERSALGIVVARFSARRREAHRFEAPPVVHVLRGEHRAISAKRAIVAASALDEQPEGIAGLQIGVEVDLAGEHVRERKRQLDAFPCRVNRLDERRRFARDAALNDELFDGLREGGELGLERARGFRPAHEQSPILIDLVLELANAAVLEAIQTVGLAGAESP